jgi:hypothetical protein
MSTLLTFSGSNLFCKYKIMQNTKYKKAKKVSGVRNSENIEEKLT